MISPETHNLAMSSSKTRESAMSSHWARVQGTSSSETREFSDDQLLLEQFAMSAFGHEPAEGSSMNPQDEEVNSNICPTCHIPMEIQSDEYICSQCGRIVQHIDGHLSNEASQMGRHDLRRYYSSSDPLKAQRSGVYESLVAHRETYLKMIAQRRGVEYVQNSALVGTDEICAAAPSTSILMNVARIYNDIQRKALAKGMPFVRRGDVKNEILAAILFVECNRSEQRSKREIAEMMGLHTDGFSRGYEQLLRQAADGNVSLDDDAKVCENKITFYYGRTLGAYIAQQFDDACAGVSMALIRETLNGFYTRFIQRIIASSIKHHIGVQSQLQSKIVGAIWFIIVAMHYPITTQKIDVMSGGIKKGTFIKFSRAIIRSARLRHIAKRFFPHLAADGAIMNLGLL